MIAVDLANHSASASFSHSIESVSGRMTHRLVSTTNALNEDVYVTLRVQYGYRRSAPIVEGEVVIQGEAITLLGIDVFAEPLFRFSDGLFSPSNMSQLLTQPNTVMLSAQTAKRLNWTPSDALTVTLDGKPQMLWLQGLLPKDSGAILDNLLITDIATAQELLNKTGRLDRIELILKNDEVEALRALLPQGHSFAETSSQHQCTTADDTCFSNQPDSNEFTGNAGRCVSGL